MMGASESSVMKLALFALMKMHAGITVIQHARTALMIQPTQERVMSVLNATAVLN
jgi:hypothetical protein